MISKTFFLSRISRRDIRVLIVLGLAATVVMGVAAIDEFSRGNIAAGVQHLGFFSLLFCSIVGPKMMALIDREREPQLAKAFDVATLLSILLICSGVVARIIA